MLKIAGLNMYKVVLIFIIHIFSSLSLVLKGCFMNERDCESGCRVMCCLLKHACYQTVLNSMRPLYIQVTGCLSLNNIIDILNG